MSLVTERQVLERDRNRLERMGERDGHVSAHRIASQRTAAIAAVAPRRAGTPIRMSDSGRGWRGWLPRSGPWW